MLSFEYLGQQQITTESSTGIRSRETIGWELSLCMRNKKRGWDWGSLHLTSVPLSLT